MEAMSQLDTLIMVSWILLIPVGVLLAIVLFKLAFLLHGASEFFSLARYELYPTIKDLRQVASRADTLSAKALSSVETLEKGFEKGAEVAGSSMGKLRSVSQGMVGGVGTMMGTVLRSMWDALWEKPKEKSR
jgi:hypothetical protein